MTCQTEAKRINATLDNIEGPVNVEVSYAESRLESVGRFLADEVIASSRIEGVQLNAAKVRSLVARRLGADQLADFLAWFNSEPNCDPLVFTAALTL